MSHNRRLSRSRHQLIMDKDIPARPRKKFWFVFFVLFFFWYLFLHGFDWSSLPGLSSVSHREENSFQSLVSNSIPKSNDISQDKQENPIPQPNDVPQDKNQENNIPKSDNVPQDKNQENNIPKFDDIPQDKSQENPILMFDDVPQRKNQENLIPTSNDGMPQDENQENTIPKSNDDLPQDKNEENLIPKSNAMETLEKGLEPPLLLKQEENNGVEKKRTWKSCTGRYIYIHELPSRFNNDYIKNCQLLNKWHDMCPYFENKGLGQSLGNPQRLFLRSGWYVTNQFSLEVIFHNRMKQYKCLTKDSSKAAAIYVPYYSGLDVSRYLFDYYNTSTKDVDSLELFKWLREKQEWNVMGGKDHFLICGRITWDFRRAIDRDIDWGNKLMLLPESQNMTMLTIESSPWDKNDFAIPYPTYFHPSSDDQIYEWQNKMRKQKRRTLFCFAGAPRPNMEGSIRGEIMAQCAASKKRCKMLECKDEKHNCLKPINVMKMFQSSIFCLQPPGDSFTRRSTFDSILAGCIPVFFHPGSAYIQYLWHLPRNYNSYSVLIPESNVKQKKVSIDNMLSQIPNSRVSTLREEVIKLIPKVIYADPRSRLEKFDDAFDLTIKGVIERVEGLKKEIREGRNNSAEFDLESSWKYYTFGTTQPHEWDDYFRRY